MEISLGPFFMGCHCCALGAGEQDTGRIAGTGENKVFNCWMPKPDIEGRAECRRRFSDHDIFVIGDKGQAIMPSRNIIIPAFPK